jgi:Spy/CpxP family protein refolding chaperone
LVLSVLVEMLVPAARLRVEDLDFVGKEEFMFRRTFTSLLAAASFVSGQVTSGNVGSGSTGSYLQRPVSFEDLKKYLVLSDTQMQQLGTLLDEQTVASQGNYEKIEAKRAELDGLLRSGSRDLTRFGQLTLDIYTLSTQTPAPVDEWRNRALAVLTAQQRARLAPLEQATKLAAAASQAVAFNLLDAPPPPEAPLSPMPLLP